MFVLFRFPRTQTKPWMSIRVTSSCVASLKTSKDTKDGDKSGDNTHLYYHHFRDVYNCSSF